MFKNTFNTIAEFISDWVVGILSGVWTIVMTFFLWEWNVNGTGLWFAWAMVLLGILTFTLNLFHVFKWDKWLVNGIRRLFKKKKK